jgi:butyryl-CoA dehydrogenase
MSDFKDEIIKEVRKFRQSVIDPIIEEDDENEKFRMDIFTKLGELGFTGMTTDEQYEGAGLGYTDFCIFLEELSKSSVPYAVTVSVSSMVQSIIQKFGSEDQKQTYLPPMAKGEEIGAFALTESSSGSDATSLKTTAVVKGDCYILNGSKLWITSGGVAKTYLVMARTGGTGAGGVSAFIVRDGDPGFEYGKAEKKMGWRTSPTRELLFKNCKIPKDRILGEEGKGINAAFSGLDAGRITIGAISVGLAQRALEESVKYSLSREQFGESIFNFQGLQFMMSEMEVETTCARLCVYEAARLLDAGTPNSKISSISKLKASDVAMKVSTDAVQVLGGVGYTKEYPTERLMRDAKVLQIVEGTNQIQKLVIARSMKSEYN